MGLSTFLTACNSGGGTNSTATSLDTKAVTPVAESSPPTSGTQTSALKVAPINANVIYLSAADDLHKTGLKGGASSMTGLHSNLSTKMLSSESSIQNTVGWVSSTNSLAPQSCWNYTFYLSTSSSQASGSASLSASQLLTQSGLTYSTKEAVSVIDSLGDSASASYSMSSLFGKENQGLTLGVDSSLYVMGNVQVTGLNSIGQNLLQNQPNQFYTQCGDKVVQSLPLTLGIKYMQTYSFESEGYNVATSAMLSTHQSSGSAFEQTAVDLSTSLYFSMGQTWMAGSITNNTIVNGNLIEADVLTNAAPYLSSCIESVGNTALASCSTGVSMLAQAAQQSYNAAVGAVNENNWQAWFNLDYGRFANKATFISTDNELKIIAPNAANILNYSKFGTYQNAIIRNVNVLRDLATANDYFHIIGSGLSHLPQDFIAGLTPYAANPGLLSQNYSGAVVAPLNALSDKVNKCINATNDADIDTQCSQLDEHETVTHIFDAYYNLTTPITNLKSALNLTLRAFVYKDIVKTTSKYVPSEIGSFIVYLPANIDANNNLSPYTLVTIPRTLGTGTNPVYAAAYQLRSPNPNQIFWDDLSSMTDDRNSAALYSQASSGALGELYGYNETLIPTQWRWLSAISDSVTAAGVGTQNCSPFGVASSGCMYTVNTYFDPAVLANNTPLTLIQQKITDTYDPALEASGNLIYSSNEFATLYPWE
ncbi:hypothetical protein CUN60_06055 [Aquella oligotrophica]|uniref:Uncharacterized protein n=2 Tax=Aquella oligotrophica TaxID=2067065 RepID=A0A2I7N5Z0_9NEIS|nr:hypothetical protein CUN60_06055 [Aquella oligotrophica]